MKIYIDTRDFWIGYYRSNTHHYVCPVPCVVIRWFRRPDTRFIKRTPVPAAPSTVRGRFSSKRRGAVEAHMSQARASWNDDSSKNFEES